LETRSPRLAPFRSRLSLKGRLTPPGIARMVLFLAADDSRMRTSQNFIVDAGRV
jgi:NAD(P)-dependent dehydrogenase (short-subunit alcohol dehydrogenase family)